MASYPSDAMPSSLPPFPVHVMNIDIHRSAVDSIQIVPFVRPPSTRHLLQAGLRVVSKLHKTPHKETKETKGDGGRQFLFIFPSQRKKTCRGDCTHLGLRSLSLPVESSLHRHLPLLLPEKTEHDEETQTDVVLGQQASKHQRKLHNKT